MDAVKFIKELRRMCAAHVGCESCSAEDCECQSLENMVEDTRIVAIVEQWSAAHPRKTRQSVFLEQWPNAYVNESDGLLVIAPCVVDETQKKKNRRCGTKKENCYQCRQEYWMQEAK